MLTELYSMTTVSAKSVPGIDKTAYKAVIFWDSFLMKKNVKLSRLLSQWPEETS